jgi:uncharacterized protein (DUF58 family)
VTGRVEDPVALARRLEIRARRLLDSRALGAYDSVFRGHGIEFSEVREYQPGDPFQAIDWKVSARIGRPFVKRFTEERELSVVLAVDISGSTRSGTRGRPLDEMASEVAAILALAAARNNDRIGLLLFTDRVEKWLPPRRGRGGMRRILHALLAVEPEGTGTDIGAALTAVAHSLKTRSLLFLISDFRSGDFSRELAAANRRHEVVALRLRDPVDDELPAAGLVSVRNPETGAEGVVDFGDEAVRAAFRRAAGTRDAREERTLRAAGCDVLTLRTDRPYAADMAAFFAGRARARLR